MFPELIAAATPVVHATAAAVQLPPSVLQQLQSGASYQPQSPLQAHAGWLTHTFATIFILSAVGLIATLAIQTTKQEGLSGTIGGRVDSTYKGRLGFEGQISRFTSFVAITFVVVATIVSLSGI